MLALSQSLRFLFRKDRASPFSPALLFPTLGTEKTTTGDFFA